MWMKTIYREIRGQRIKIGQLTLLSYFLRSSWSTWRVWGEAIFSLIVVSVSPLFLLVWKCSCTCTCNCWPCLEARTKAMWPQWHHHKMMLRRSHCAAKKVGGAGILAPTGYIIWPKVLKAGSRWTTQTWRSWRSVLESLFRGSRRQWQNTASL